MESHIRWEIGLFARGHSKCTVICGFEMLEAGRWPAYVNKDAVVIVNRYRIPPPATNLGKASYPQEGDRFLLKSCFQVFWVNATEIAKDLQQPCGGWCSFTGSSFRFGRRRELAMLLNVWFGKICGIKYELLG